MKITLSTIARLQIMNILNEQGKGRGSDREYGITADLYEKIEIPDEVQESMSIRRPDGLRQLNPDALRSLPDLTVDLNHNEAAKLEKILTEVDIKPMDRKLWYRNVMAQLEEAKKPALDDEPTKTQRLADIRSAGRK